MVDQPTIEQQTLLTAHTARDGRGQVVTVGEMPAVARRLRARGFALPPRGKGQRRPEPSAAHLRARGIADLAAFDLEVAALYAEGRSVNALAKAYGVGDQAERTSLYRSGLTLRGKGGKPSKSVPNAAEPARRIRSPPAATV
jgi:hypothetical protein